MSDHATGIRVMLTRAEALDETGHLVELAPFGEGCPCVVDHAPAAYVTVVHHVVPLSWNGPNTPENKIRICVQTHEATHRLIDDHIRFGGVPPWAHRRRFNTLQRELAARAWAARPEKPTYTSGAH